MTGNAQPNASSASGCQPECACGMAFPCPWDLVGHLLEMSPPSARQPRDGDQHANATRLSVKLGTAPGGAWEVVTWATDQRSALRVAASIAYRVKTGDLKRFDTMIRQDIRDTYQLVAAVARRALLGPATMNVTGCGIRFCVVQLRAARWRSRMARLSVKLAAALPSMPAQTSWTSAWAISAPRMGC